MLQLPRLHACWSNQDRTFIAWLLIVFISTAMMCQSQTFSLRFLLIKLQKIKIPKTLCDLLGIEREAEEEEKRRGRYVGNCSRSSCWGAEGMAEEPSSCPYYHSAFAFFHIWFCHSLELFCFLFLFLFLFLLPSIESMSVFSLIGFCGEAWDPAGWYREFDGVALHYSRQVWGVSLFTYSSLNSILFLVRFYALLLLKLLYSSKFQICTRIVWLLLTCCFLNLILTEDFILFISFPRMEETLGRNYWGEVLFIWSM